MKSIFTYILSLLSTAGFSQTPDSSSYFFQRGAEEKAARRYLVASNHYDKAIQLNQNYTAAYVEKGYVNLEMRRIDVAKQNFTKALELDPGNEAAIKELVELYYSYRQFQKAIDFAQKCNTCENADRIIALSYYQLEDYGKAEKILLSIISKNPEDAEITYTIARNYMDMGLEGKAIPWYEKAVQLAETKSSWVFELGLLYYNNDNFKKAVECFNKAIVNGFIQSNDFNENLGFAYIFSGDFDKGEKLLLEIIARKPGNTEILRDVAEAYYERKMYDKSLEFCQKLMELDMNDGKALYQAGLCFQKKGQTEKGKQMCDRAIEMNPSLAGLRQKRMNPGM